MLAVATPRTDSVLPVVRGVTVGGFAASVAIISHSAAMPSHVPSAGTVAFLLVVCSALGATAAGRWKRPPASWQLVGILTAAQIAGHLALSVGSAHALEALTPTMIAAHAVGILVGAVVVDAAERAARRSLALLNQLLYADLPPVAAHARPWSLITSGEPQITSRDTAGQHIRRGPPTAVALVCP